MDALYPSLRSGNASPRGDILIKKIIAKKLYNVLEFHPHACGENYVAHNSLCAFHDSPPLVWGLPQMDTDERR